MKTAITHISILVADQAKALDFYTHKLGFRLHTDALFGEGFRWLTVCPVDNDQFEMAILGKQAGSYPLLSLSTDNCKKLYEELSARGVEFMQEPAEKPWGIETVCKDLYGNMIHINQTV